MKETQDTLLLFSIGPVQDFLAAARKTSDLYAGSKLLSHLVSVAIETIAELGGELVYPARDKDVDRSDQHAASLPNRILCRIRPDSGTMVGEAAKENVMTELTRIAEFARNSFNVDAGDLVWATFWDQQIPKFIEIYYVVGDGAAEDYGGQLRILETCLGRRKTLRDFEELRYSDGLELSPGQPGTKCSLIKNLSAVHPKGSTKQGGDFLKETHRLARTFWDAQAKHRPGDYRPNERLSSLALTKRKFFRYMKDRKLLTEVVSFPSTTTLAAGAFYRSLGVACAENSTLQAAVEAFTRQTSTMLASLGPTKAANYPALKRQGSPVIKRLLDIDGDWLHEEQYQEKRLSDAFGAVNEPIRALAAETLRCRKAMLEAIQSHNRGQTAASSQVALPAKYYAVILLDGDRMGERISKSLAGETHQAAQNKHGAISRALNSFFSHTTRDILEGAADNVPRLGKIIYAGGDDLLAVCALEDLFEILIDLRMRFEEDVSPVADFVATASVGVAIAHHQMNLQQALQEVRRAEQFSKSGLLRDAVSFALLKRSGEHSTCGARWFVGETPNPLQMMAEFAKFIRNRIVSTSFIYDLANERPGLEVLPAKGIAAETRRLLGRHAAEGSEDVVSDFATARMAPVYEQLARHRDERIDAGLNPPSVLRQLLDLLEVAQFIGRGGER